MLPAAAPRRWHCMPMGSAVGRDNPKRKQTKNRSESVDGSVPSFLACFICVLLCGGLAPACLMPPSSPFHHHHASAGAGSLPLGSIAPKASNQSNQIISGRSCPGWRAALSFRLHGEAAITRAANKIANTNLVEPQDRQQQQQQPFRKYVRGFEKKKRKETVHPLDMDGNCG